MIGNLQVHDGEQNQQAHSKQDRSKQARSHLQVPDGEPKKQAGNSGNGRVAFFFPIQKTRQKNADVFKEKSTSVAILLNLGQVVRTWERERERERERRVTVGKYGGDRTISEQVRRET